MHFLNSETSNNFNVEQQSDSLAGSSHELFATLVIF